jgi:transcriptional regulator with XRE-family HTH domain
MASENDMPRALHWDLVDRLHKSLRLSGFEVQEMAESLECHRNTIGGWLNDRNRPYPASLQMWAQKTGVPYEWLRDGKWPGADQWDQAELPARERLREMSAALLQIADQLETRT